MQVDVPLQLRVTQSLDVQSMSTPTQPEASHVSPHVHGSPSSQLALGCQRQVPPSRVQ